MPTRRPDPADFLPLASDALLILLALASKPLHGYGIIREVDTRTDGLIKLRSGTLYTLLQRLLAEALIVESDERPHAEEDDERRRYYALTEFGRAVLTAEARRLESAIGEARRKHVIGKTRA